jgi:hypothetical protein
VDATPLLIEAVHLVEERRDSLNLVDHNPFAPPQRCDQPGECGRVAAEFEEAA